MSRHGSCSILAAAALRPAPTSASPAPLAYTEGMAQAQRNEILDAALALDPLERAQVAHQLIVSIESNAHVNAELLDQLEDQIDVELAKKTLAEMKANGEEPVALEGVKKRLGM